MQTMEDSVIKDRIKRYQANEPLKDIAASYGVTIAAILDTVKRYAPDLVGHRQRGPLPAWVHDEAKRKAREERGTSPRPKKKAQGSRSTRA